MDVRPLLGRNQTLISTAFLFDIISMCAVAISGMHQWRMG